MPKHFPVFKVDKMSPLILLAVEENWLKPFVRQPSGLSDHICWVVFEGCNIDLGN